MLWTDMVDLYLDFLGSYPQEGFLFFLLEIAHSLLDAFRLSIATHDDSELTQFTYFFCLDSTDSIFRKLRRSAEGLNLIPIVASRYARVSCIYTAWLCLRSYICCTAWDYNCYIFSSHAFVNSSNSSLFCSSIWSSSLSCLSTRDTFRPPSACWRTL